MNGLGDEDRNKGDGDGECENENTRESLDKEEEDEENGTDRNLEMTGVPTMEEVKEAVDKLKKNKAPGPDGIPSEILKEGYKYMENRIYELKVQIWKEETIPLTWVEALICSIAKQVMFKFVRISEEFRWLIFHIKYCQSCYMED